jgi:hypothetical protein
MTLKLYGISYERNTWKKSNYGASFDSAVRDFINNKDSWERNGLEDQLERTQQLMANIVEHLVKKNLMNNEEFQTVFEQSRHRPEYELLPREED